MLEELSRVLEVLEELSRVLEELSGVSAREELSGVSAREELSRVLVVLLGGGWTHADNSLYVAAPLHSSSMIQATSFIDRHIYLLDMTKGYVLKNLIQQGIDQTLFVKIRAFQTVFYIYILVI